MNVKNCVAL